MSNLPPKRARKAVMWLSVLTPCAALLSLLNVSISLVTSVWLETTEQIFVDSSNLTNPRQEVPRTKRTLSGLFLLCEYHNLTLVNGTVEHCFYIDYFAKERYTPEPHDSTMAIPYTVTKAGPIFFVASFLLATGIMWTLLGYFWRRIRVIIFIAGVIIIVSGLIMFIGLVVYLSVLQAEVGQKLRPRNSLDKPLFVYHYGYSFILLAVGSMFTEITGTCITLWYIYWHQLDWAHKTGIHQRLHPPRPPSHPHKHTPHKNNRRPSRRHTSRQSQEDTFYTKQTTPNTHNPHNPHFYDRSTPSGDECKNHPNSAHRSRSSSHSGIHSTRIQDSLNYQEYNKLYPCKKHGTIPPRHHCLPPLSPPNFTQPYCTPHFPMNPTNQSISPLTQCTTKSAAALNPTHFCPGGYFDNDLFDLPLPPPPPIQRDITLITTLSQDDIFFQNYPSSVSVATNTENCAGRKQECKERLSVARDPPKTTPV